MLYRVLSQLDTLLATTDPVRCTHIEGRPSIVLSGTRNIFDIVDDIDVRRRRFDLTNPSTVHEGMFRRALRFWGSDEVQNFLLEEDAVDLIGWSLGGGSAVHLASILNVYGVRVSSVSLFGSPMCGDRMFCRWYAYAGLYRRTIRYETPHDPIVHLPPGNYAPVGRRILLPCNRTGRLAHHDLSAYREGAKERLNSRVVP